MKKFLLIAGGTVIMSAASVWGYSYHQEQTMDPWLKANIAALSSAEDNPGSICGGLPQYAHVSYSVNRREVYRHFYGEIDEIMQYTYTECTATGEGRLAGSNHTISSDCQVIGYDVCRNKCVSL